MHPAKIANVLALDGPERYWYCVRKVADSEEVWGLFSEGWFCATDNEGRLAWAVWPEREFAELCAQNEWAASVATALPLDEFLSRLKERGDELVVVFPTPGNKGIFVSSDRFATDLEVEASQYE